MTDHAPLTDKELDRIEDVAERLHGHKYLSEEEEVCRDDVPRLIADLRAARAEVERLRGELAKADRYRLEA